MLLQAAMSLACDEQVSEWLSCQHGRVGGGGIYPPDVLLTRGVKTNDSNRILWDVLWNKISVFLWSPSYTPGKFFINSLVLCSLGIANVTSLMTTVLVLLVRMISKHLLLTYFSAGELLEHLHINISYNFLTRSKPALPFRDSFLFSSRKQLWSTGKDLLCSF